MLKSDLHIHTLMSGHAFGTFDECVKTAEKKGISLIAITDHGPAMEHSAHEGYFEMALRLPKNINGVNVLFGCETNILDCRGNIDISENTLLGLDIVLAGLHKRTSFFSSGEADNTKAIINAMKKYPEINIITHPYRYDFPISVRDVVQAAVEYNVILEVNASVFVKSFKNKARSEAIWEIDKTAEMISYLNSLGIGYVINSDAHCTYEIGISDELYSLMEAKLGIKKEYVLNDRIDILKGYIPSINGIIVK